MVNAQPAIGRLALRVALQFSLAYGVASLGLGVALGVLARALPLDAVLFWLVVRLAALVPAGLSPSTDVEYAVYMVLKASGLALANFLLVAALLAPILRWNLKRARRDLAEEFA